jgi:hypothetical protein
MADGGSAKIKDHGREVFHSTGCARGCRSLIGDYADFRFRAAEGSKQASACGRLHQNVVKATAGGRVRGLFP